jgi:CRISPR/Cas system-associated protein endoribonuclease Cas2
MQTIEKLVPAAGNVRLLFITDQQWARSVNVVGPNYEQGRRALDPKVPRQIEFWE